MRELFNLLALYNARTWFGPAHPDVYQKERILELISATQQLLS